MNRIPFGSYTRFNVAVAVTVFVPLAISGLIGMQLVFALTKGEAIGSAGIAIVLALVGMLFFDAVPRFAWKLVLTGSMMILFGYGLWNLVVYGLWWAAALSLCLLVGTGAAGASRTERKSRSNTLSE